MKKLNMSKQVKLVLILLGFFVWESTEYREIYKSVHSELSDLKPLLRSKPRVIPKCLRNLRDNYRFDSRHRYIVLHNDDLNSEIKEPSPVVTPPPWKTRKYRRYKTQHPRYYERRLPNKDQVRHKNSNSAFRLHRENMKIIKEMMSKLRMELGDIKKAIKISM